MKKYVAFCYLLTMGLIVTSCVDSNKKAKDATNNQTAENGFKEVKVGNEYFLSLPDFMENARGLNNQASLQYQNTDKEIYTIVIGEPKARLEPLLKPTKGKHADKSLISMYTEIQMRLLSEAVDIKTKSTSVPLKIDGMEAEMVELTGAVPGIEEDIFYLLTLIEGKAKIYMVMSYTLSSEKENHVAAFKHIANSFKLVE
ncbi:hypothetical protein GTQ34_01675 [Muricauda sp. JGD-17]|uniref:DUF1795 domain-containing protein n=1 Tax=Flagellimonas ochracea TaxID=2696472 RepID=A0A964T9A2_9FLAO|nr:hypothetical protein [Allomuricauda ochracea]NAY90615.1 hypothetical protein [Allomuricauda ochracea]